MHDCIIQPRRAGQIVPSVLKCAGADYTVENEKGFNILQWAALKNNREYGDTQFTAFT